MDYPILSLSSEGAEEAAKKLHFALATERARGAEFLRVDFLSSEKERARLLGAVSRVLRERKRNGKILFFVGAEDFVSEKPESAYIANKYSALLEDASLLAGENGFVLIKL